MTTNGGEPDESVWAEYREETRQNAPTRLAELVRARLPRSPLILPGVTAACLLSSIALTAFVTFFLTAPDPTSPPQPVAPPPVFGELQDGLFPPTVSLEPR